MDKEIVTGFSTHAGGVLTVEVGVLRGELILATRLIAGYREEPLVETLAEYVGAEDRYTVAGPPVPLASLGRTHERAHWEAIERLQTPVGDNWLNEPPADLRGRAGPL